MNPNIKPSTGLAALGALACLSGCVREPLTAPYNSQLSLSPSELRVDPSSYLLSFDNKGVVDFADAFVYSTSTGLPLEHIKVEVISQSSGVYIIPTEAIQTQDYPEAPEDWETLKDEVCVDDAGNFIATEDWCAWYYDSVTGTYLSFGNSYADADGYRPDYFSDGTDGYGRLRFYFFIDVMPYSAEDDSSGGGDDGGGEGGDDTGALEGEGEGEAPPADDVTFSDASFSSVAIRVSTGVDTELLSIEVTN